MGVICGIYAPGSSVSSRTSILEAMCEQLTQTILSSHTCHIEDCFSLTCFEHPALTSGLGIDQFTYRSPDGEWLIGDLSLYNLEDIAEDPDDTELCAVQKYLKKNGDKALSEISGDFCLIRIDPSTDEHTFFRDTIGHKSMFICKTEFGYVFSSIAQPVTKFTRNITKPSLQSLASFFFLKHPGRGKTYYEDVHEIPAASYCSVIGGEIRDTTLYWRPSRIDRYAKLPADEQLYELRKMLELSVSQRLDEASNRSALQLSGGLDSSALAGLMCHVRPGEKFHAISSVLPENHSGTAEDERQYISAVLERWPSMKPNYITDQQNELLSSNAFWHEWFAAPNPDLFNNINTAIENKMEKTNCRVLLTGLGGDECVSAWGLPALTEFFYAGRLNRAKQELARLRKKYKNATLTRLLLVKLVIPYLPNHVRQLYKRLRKVNWNHEVPISQKLASSTQFKRHLVENGFQLIPKAYRNMHEYEIDNLSLFDQYNLPVYDFAANLNGFRFRYPLLDHRLIDLALSLPTDLKVGKDRDRMLLRNACADLLPDEVRFRNDKKPFYPGFMLAYESKKSEMEKTINALSSFPLWQELISMDHYRNIVSRSDEKDFSAAIRKLHIHSMAEFLSQVDHA